ncbi:hypothetical protein RchiOBHm_Chr7g0243121 [Rosa chinensis]|uniref:Uncharacterized protein n=1 Tax=Rosa chinensis TaxID=74649 RepID=A0A2P6PIN1_ROSCH|nr:hypothetical protein RchiOBHm_Chr7g0243121 [Rosa chinensis]
MHCYTVLSTVKFCFCPWIFVVISGCHWCVHNREVWKPLSRVRVSHRHQQRKKAWYPSFQFSKISNPLNPIESKSSSFRSPPNRKGLAILICTTREVKMRKRRRTMKKRAMLMLFRAMQLKQNKKKKKKMTMRLKLL